MELMMAAKGGFWAKKKNGANLYFVTKDGRVAGEHPGVDAKDLVRSSTPKVGGGTLDPGADTGRDVAGTFDGRPVRWAEGKPSVTPEFEEQLLSSLPQQIEGLTIAQKQRLVSHLDQGLKPSGYETPMSGPNKGKRIPTLRRNVSFDPTQRYVTVSRRTAQRLRDALAETLPQALRPKAPAIFD